jgi:uncharacterized protein (TIGR02594 family)
MKFVIKDKEDNKNQKKEKCPNCDKEITLKEMKEIFPDCKDEKRLKESMEAFNKYKKEFRMDTCWNKAHFFAQARIETGASLNINSESFNYYWEDLIENFGAFNTEKGKKKAKEWGRAINKKSDNPKEYKDVSLENQEKIANWAYAPGTRTGRQLENKQDDDGWRFRGRGFIQITGRGNYTKANKYTLKYANTEILTDAGASKVGEPTGAMIACMAYWIERNIQIAANGEKDVRNISKKIGKDVKGSHVKKKATFDNVTSKLFKVDECLWEKSKNTTANLNERAPWMKIVLGEAANYGGKHESSIGDRIKEYHKNGGNISAKYSTPWCSSFACWCLEQSQYKNPKSASSKNFMLSSHMEKCNVFYGAIAVFSDCDINGAPKSTGHVGFIYGKLPNNKYALLGGNQKDMIKVSEYDCSGNAFFSYKDNKGKKHYKLFRGFYKPKQYLIKEIDKLINSDNTTVNQANEAIIQKIIITTNKGESSR